MSAFNKLPKRLQDYLKAFRLENLDTLEGHVVTMPLEDYDEENLQKLIMFAIVKDLSNN